MQQIHILLVDDNEGDILLTKEGFVLYLVLVLLQLCGFVAIIL